MPTTKFNLTCELYSTQPFVHNYTCILFDIQIPPSQQMIQFKDDFGGKETLKSSLTGGNFG